MESLGDRKLISVVIPAYNEEANVRPAYDAVRDVFAELADRYEFEIVFTDNHSTDSTFAEITELAAEDPRVRAARFTRNFGFHRSVLTGFRLSRGDAVIQLDCDLQDPPGVFPQFLALWEKGHDVVVGIRRLRDEGPLLQWGRRLYYRLLALASDDNLVLDGGDFRLVDHTIVDQLRAIDDAAPYTRGLTSLLATNQTGVPYDRKVRGRGQSKFPLRKLTGFAVTGFVTHSTIPLRIATYAGLLIATITFLASVFYIAARLAFGVNWPAGFATTTALILFSTSLNAIFLGIIGEYVGRIYNQVRVRPATVVEKAVNISPDASVTGSHESPPNTTRSGATREIACRPMRR